jgi:spore germination protein
MHNISVMQLLRNNPILAGREYIYPGELLVISYGTNRSITTFGFSYSFIDENVLRKTLPNLTYLSVINYRALDQGEIIELYDDTRIIQIAKEYGTIPLLMITTLTESGMTDFDLTYKLLLNDEYQDRHINELLNILRTKGYLGVNFVFSFMNTSNQDLYFRLLQKASSRLGSHGYSIYVTINPNDRNINGEIVFKKIDYSKISRYAESVTFLQLVWSLNYGPPQPVSSAANLRSFTEYVIEYVPARKVILGIPILAYDWIIPYTPRNPAALTLTINSAIRLAVDVNAVINFDETSQTPYFTYVQTPIGSPVEHIVWFIDARSFSALLNIINTYRLNGTAAWNIMVYSPQFWLMINSQYSIVKLLPTI